MRSRREPLRMRGWRRSCGVIDRMIASTRSISRSSKLSSCSRSSPMPGSIPSIFFSEPMFFRAAICCRKSSSVKSSSAANLAAIFSAWSASNAFCGLLDEGEHVAHVEDARGHPVGVEQLELVELLAGRGEHDRPAGDADDGQRRATAGVAVELGQHDAGEADAVQEGLRGGDGVLADHRVERRRGSRPGCTASRMSAACCIISASTPSRPAVSTMTTSCCFSRANRDAVARPPRPGRRGPAVGCRAAGDVPGVRGEDGDAGPLADDLELVDGVRALQVAGHEQRGVALLLAASGRACRPAWSCPAPCRPASMITVGGRLGELQPPGLAAEHGDQLVVDDLDDLLGRVQRLRDLGRQRALADRAR